MVRTRKRGGQPVRASEGAGDHDAAHAQQQRRRSKRARVAAPVTHNGPVDDLPDGVLIAIFGFLPLHSFFHASLVCRRWAALLKSRSLFTEVDMSLLCCEARSTSLKRMVSSQMGGHTRSLRFCPRTFVGSRETVVHDMILQLPNLRRLHVVPSVEGNEHHSPWDGMDTAPPHRDRLASHSRGFRLPAGLQELSLSGLANVDWDECPLPNLKVAKIYGDFFPHCIRPLENPLHLSVFQEVDPFLAASPNLEELHVHARMYLHPHSISRMVDRLPKLKRLCLRGISFDVLLSNAEALALCTSVFDCLVGLESLDLACDLYSPGVVQALVQRLPHLKSLQLTFENSFQDDYDEPTEEIVRRDLSCLADLTHIRLLKIVVPGFSHLSEMSSTLAKGELPRLETLALCTFDDLPITRSGLRAVGAMENLRELALQGIRFLFDQRALTPLVGLKHLRSLMVEGRLTLGGITVITGLNLTGLCINRCNGITPKALSELAAGVGQRLEVFHAGFVEPVPSKAGVEILCTMPRLKSINLSGWRMSEESLKLVLHHFRDVRFLGLSECSGLTHDAFSAACSALRFPSQAIVYREQQGLLDFEFDEHNPYF
eukprot:m.155418 g.155418  ORF g.155418 m.155418 type:complete len:601 (-) comp17529_c0_seq1:79-1881(-)